MWNMATRILFLLFSPLLLLTACHKPDFSVYLEDEIYLDLKKSSETFHREAESEKKKANELIEQIERSQPQSGQAVAFIRQKNDAEARAQKAEQKSEFYKLRMVARQKQVIRDYLKAFNSGKSYEKNVGVEQYKEIEKLNAASRNWNDRVPKMRSPASKGKPKKAEGEGHGEGGGEKAEGGGESGHE